MASYKLVFKRSVAKDLRDIPAQDVQRLLASIRRLAAEPRPSGGQKLSARERYRVRVGRYRVLYEIRDYELVVMVAAQCPIR